MTLQLKRRLIGALVLALLLVLLIPTLLHLYRRPSHLSLNSDIPQAPANTDTPLQLPDQNAAPAKNVDTQMTTAQPVSQAPQKKDSNVTAAQEPANAPKAWVIRVGSFSELAHATNLIAELRGKGFDAYTRVVNTRKGQLTEVYIGPEIERDKVVALKKAIQDQFNLKGDILRYKVMTK